MEQSLKVLILAGGHSTRMGSDKGLVLYQGIPFIRYLLDVIDNMGIQAFVSLREEQKSVYNIQNMNIQVIDDLILYPEGPVRGILSAHHHFPFFNWIVIPVDMPLLAKDVLVHLTEMPCSATFEIDGKRHPFPCRIQAEDLRRWMHSPRPDSPVKTMDWLKMPMIPGKDSWLRNWNTPFDIGS